MKKIIIYLLSFLIIGINTSFAASSLTKAPTLVNSQAKSLEITWEKLDSASGYFVYYTESSGKNYKTFGDIIEENKVNITGLKENTKYYVVVTVLDKTTEEESDFSPEGVFTTNSENNSTLALTKVEVKNPIELELSFNKSIDQSVDAIREFKITKDNKEITKVKEVKTMNDDKNKLTLILSNSISAGEYKIVVISITDEEGNNIEEGINGELKFIAPDFNKTSNDIPEDSKINTVIDQIFNQDVDTGRTQESDNTLKKGIYEEEKEVNLNAGSPEEETQNLGPSGTNMTGVLSTGEVVAGDAKKLPKTGPEHIFLILISMFIGGLYIKKRKIS